MYNHHHTIHPNTTTTQPPSPSHLYTHPPYHVPHTILSTITSFTSTSHKTSRCRGKDPGVRQDQQSWHLLSFLVYIRPPSFNVSLLLLTLHPLNDCVFFARISQQHMHPLVVIHKQHTYISKKERRERSEQHSIEEGGFTFTKCRDYGKEGLWHSRHSSNKRQLLIYF